jgi:hypothetical protein
LAVKATYAEGNACVGSQQLAVLVGYVSDIHSQIRDNGDTGQILIGSASSYKLEKDNWFSK